MLMNRRTATAHVLWVLQMFGSACTSSHDTAPEGEEPDDAVVSAGARSVGNAGQGGGYSGATVSESGALICGPSECTLPSSPLQGLTGGLSSLLPAAKACCVDADSGACGVTSASAGAACEPLAVADIRCPGFDLSGLQDVGGQLGGLITLASATMVGCCIDNQCGQDGAMFGRGCVENSQAKTLLGAVPLFGSAVKVPEASSCARAGTDALINFFQSFAPPQ